MSQSYPGLAVVEGPPSRSPSRYVQKPGRAAHCGVTWRRVAQVPSDSCVGAWRVWSGRSAEGRAGPWTVGSRPP